MQILTKRKITSRQQLLQAMEPLLEKGGFWIMNGRLEGDERCCGGEGSTEKADRREGSLCYVDEDSFVLILPECEDAGCEADDGRCVPDIAGWIRVRCVCVYSM